MPDYCEICGRRTEKFIILPIKQPNGDLDTLSCAECATKSSAYCSIHQAIHLGYPDGTTACPACIEEIVASEGAVIGSRVLRNADLADEYWQQLLEWARDVQEITRETGIRVVSRAITSYALRFNLSTDQVIKMVAVDGPRIILPPIII